MLSKAPLSICLMKPWVVSTSGTTAPLKRPISASQALRPSKNTTSSPRDSTRALTSAGLRWTPPPITPSGPTLTSSGVPKATSSSRTFTDSFGKSTMRFQAARRSLPPFHSGWSSSNPLPSDHFTVSDRDLNGGYSRVRLMYCLHASISPPTVPLMPWGETMIRPRSPRRSQSSRCQSITE